MPAAGEIIRATFSARLDGQLVENVVHVREIIEATVDEAIALSLEVLRNLLTSCQSSSLVYNQTRWKRMTPVPLDEQFIGLTGNLTGARGSGWVPNTVAQILTLRTGVAGKTHRGRMYLPGFAGDISGTNGPNSSGLTILNTLAANMISTFGTSGSDANLRLGIYSRVIGGSLPMTLAGWQQVAQVVPQPVYGNQRRRRPGVGA